MPPKDEMFNPDKTQKSRTNFYAAVNVCSQLRDASVAEFDEIVLVK